MHSAKFKAKLAVIAVLAMTILALIPANSASANEYPDLKWVNAGSLPSPINGTLVKLAPGNDLVFESAAVGCGITPYNANCATPEPVGVHVYLPENYDANRPEGYKVLYALHGMNGNEYNFLGTFGSSLWSSSNPASVIDQKLVDDAIVVYPNGAKGSGYIDSANSAPSETMIIKELIPFIDANYNTLASKEGRAVHGFSMGGYGALYFGTKYPEMFGIVSGLSSACHKITIPVPVDAPTVAACDYIKASVEDNIQANANELKSTTFIMANGSSNDFGDKDHAALKTTFDQLGISSVHIRVPNIGHDNAGHHNTYLAGYGMTYGQYVMTTFVEAEVTNPNPDPTPTPTPEPSPEPTPSPSPTPSPEPTPEPTPEPGAGVDAGEDVVENQSGRGNTVTLSGTVTSTKTVASVEWVYESGPVASVQSRDMASLSTQVRLNTKGTYTFVLNVTFADGSVASDVMTVTIL